MKYVVFGAQGQLGHRLVSELSAAGSSVVGLGRADVDVTSREQVAAAIAEHTPDVVFNGAAYNAVDQAESDADAAMRLNAYAPGVLAAACREAGASFTHFSTDYVFGDGFDAPIDESREPAPLSVYGRSKLLGERVALANNPRTYVMRCCGLYSGRRRNFVRTMIHHALKGTPLRVVSDQYVSPTWVAPLARVAIELADTGLYGTYHAVAHGQCSWFEYAGAIFEELGLEANLSPVLQADWGAAAPRPSYSSLDNMMLRQLGLDGFSDWREDLSAFLADHGAQIVEQERAVLAGG